MNRAFVYLLLTLVIAGSCMFEYCGARLFSRFSAYKQNRISVAVIGIGALALAVFRSNILVTNCLVLVGALVAGTLLSRQIGSIGALSTMLIVAALWTLSRRMLAPHAGWSTKLSHAGGVPALQFLVVSLRLKEKLVPVVGVGDLILFAAVVSVVRRLGWPETSAFEVPLAGVLAALGVGLFTGFTPALPFLAGAVLFYAYALNPGHEPCRG